MRISLALTLVIFTVLTVCSQPYYKIEEFNIRSGEKDKYYLKQAKKNLDGKEKDANVSDRFLSNMALFNAATGLKITEKKGTLSDLQEILRLNYEKIINANLTTIEDLSGEPISVDEHVTNKAHILNYYMVMNECNQVLRSIPDAKFEGAKKKDPNLTLNISDFSTEVKQAKQAFEDAKMAAATAHYDEARGLARSQSLKDNKAAAKRFRWAFEYIPEFRDAEERYDKSKLLGTTRLGMTELENITNSEFGNIGFIISNNVIEKFSERKNDFEFFEVLDRDVLDRVLKEQKLSLSGLMDDNTNLELGEIPGVHSLLYGKIVLATVDKDLIGPVDRVFTKTVKVGEEKYTDENGEEQSRDVKEEVSVTMKKYEKKSSASIEVAYKIIDVATGATITSDNLKQVTLWDANWYSYKSGDKRAIPRSIERDEMKYISSSKLISDTANNLSNKLYNSIAVYGRQVSN